MYGFRNFNINRCRHLFRIIVYRSEKSINVNRLFSSNVETKNTFDGPGLKHFISKSRVSQDVSIEHDFLPYIETEYLNGRGRKVYFDVHGCQMNVNDCEIVWSVLQSAGYDKTTELNDADVILMMTCAIRENAENRIWNKLQNYKHLKKKALKSRSDLIKIGILGCMAERLKEKILEKERTVDVVAGPDSYKDLPRLLAVTENNQAAVNVLLSLDETYADVVPVRLNQDSVTAFVSIMRGCDNMCTYCIVPFTRGKERSRPIDSILREMDNLASLGVKEVTLLGQNVNSYRDLSEGAKSVETTHLAPGFRTVYKPKKGGTRFSELLDRVASAHPGIRIRFTSPHPKDFPKEVLEVMSSHKNICKSIHLPAQSGNNDVLERMRRGYTVEAYLSLVEEIRKHMPDVTLSSDFICGFCGETEDQFNDTLDLIREVRYHQAYLFAYSMREKTTAHRRYQDNVPSEVKQARLERMMSLYRSLAKDLNAQFEGTTQTVLVEGASKRSPDFLQGRISGNIKVIIPAANLPDEFTKSVTPIMFGDYISVKITGSNSQVLKGLPLYRINRDR